MLWGPEPGTGNPVDVGHHVPTAWNTNMHTAAIPAYSIYAFQALEVNCNGREGGTPPAPPRRDPSWEPDGTDTHPHAKGKTANGQPVSFGRIEHRPRYITHMYTIYMCSIPLR